MRRAEAKILPIRGFGRVDLNWNGQKQTADIVSSFQKSLPAERRGKSRKLNQDCVVAEHAGAMKNDFSGTLSGRS
ncbi:MAG: hypothetical protein R2853_19910 [Thermomicrobiales bacterium]